MIKKTLISITITLLALSFVSCKKKAGTGGKSNITIFPECDQCGNNGMTSIKGASVYVWFDGSNVTDGIFSPKKNPETADLTVIGDPNEDFVTLPPLKPGSYAWTILASDPSFWKMLRGSGGQEIRWSERKKNFNIHTKLY